MKQTKIFESFSVIKSFSVSVIFILLVKTLMMSQAYASPVGYTNFTDWNNAIGLANVTQEDFSSSPVGNFSAGLTDIGSFNIFVDREDPGPTIDPVFLTGISNIFDFSNGTNAFIGNLAIQPFFIGVYELRFEFDTPIVGFAGTWESPVGDDQLDIIVNGETVQFDDSFLPPDEIGFFGIVDSMASFTTIGFSLRDTLPGTNGEIFGLDNVFIASTADPVPEPTTIALLGIGLAGLSGAEVRRRWKRRQLIKKQ
ncbi:triosephosphate isomerase [Candidatus Scalindua japonica]|uniref:Triosephosphate isomerase n=1 Tax=Candidatus Scalindua japonica TaxID=1284222 RepID=A0A286U0A2_9BACT|nr:PEP-CTERM sorting domain-containing protein [Candidatus Scalindua japonica]GAX61556.1 triosephosphate isomerase [Candidatus Scalindua japonica]